MNHEMSDGPSRVTEDDLKIRPDLRQAVEEGRIYAEQQKEAAAKAWADAGTTEEELETNREITEAVIGMVQQEFNAALFRFIDGMQQGNLGGRDITAILYCLLKEQMNAGRYDDFLRELDTIPDSEAKGSTEKMLHYYIRQSPYNIPLNLRLSFKSYRTQIVYGIEMLRKDYRGELSITDVSVWIDKAGGIDQLHRDWNRELTAKARLRRGKARAEEDQRSKDEAVLLHNVLEVEATSLGISIEELQVRRRNVKAKEIKIAKEKRNAASMRRLQEQAISDDDDDGLLIRVNGKLMKLCQNDTIVMLNCASTLT